MGKEPEKHDEFKGYISKNIKDETILAEMLVIKIFSYLIPVFILVTTGYFLYYWFAEKILSIFYIILIIYLVAVLFYYRIIYNRFKKGLQSILIGFINVGIEVSTVTIVILLLYKTLNAEIILTGPLVMVYLLMVIMSGFRYSLRLSLFAGIMGAFQHILIYVFLIREVPPEIFSRIMDLGFSGIFQKSLYILMGGVISGYLAINTKKLIMKIGHKSVEIQQVKSTFAQYVSEEISDSILEGKVDLGGDESSGIVLFSDIRNFTTLLENNDPKAVVHQMNEYFSEMVNVINNNHGIVNKFIGDEIMAVFGLFQNDPRKYEQYAVKAALEMFKSLSRMNEKWKQEGKYTMDIGVGIAAGSFLIGNIGSENRKEFTCIGDVVNTASRLQELTKYYLSKIIITHQLAESLKDTYMIRMIDLVQLKGKKNASRIYEVIDEKNENFILKYKKAQPYFEKALNLYMRGNFSGAEKIYDELIGFFGVNNSLTDKCLDPVLNFYKTRCSYLKVQQQAGLLGEWSGIYEFKEK